MITLLVKIKFFLIDAKFAPQVGFCLQIMHVEFLILNGKNIKKLVSLVVLSGFLNHINKNQNTFLKNACK
jgi:hypothetical protein